MEILSQLLSGFAEIFNVASILAISAGVLAGITVGALPGLTATMTIAILTPVTFSLAPDIGIALLLGVFVGGIYGGSITAILINTPGTPASIATTFDGYPMTKMGKAGQALYMALFSSVGGGLISGVVLICIAPQLAKIALQFGPPEYFGLTVFGISIISSVSGQMLIKGLIAGVIGILLSTVGMDGITGVPRFTFGSTAMLSGFNLIPILIGVFAVSEVFYQIINPVLKKDDFEGKISGVYIKLKEMKQYLFTIIRSGLIGTFIGVVPGTGGGIAAFVSYAEAKRASKNPESYGKGDADGVAAAESANNATTGGALVPMLTLGIPGDPVTAVLIGAFMIQGLQPGPLLFQENASTVYALFAGLLLANIILFILGVIGLRYFAKVANIPQQVLGPIVLLLCFVGSYAVANSMVDVAAMLVMGIIGFFMKQYGFPGAPLVIGMILGPMVEKALRQSLTLSNGEWSIFIYSPICAAFLALTICVSIVLPIYRARKDARVL
ncbi:tripartite tricarboxylate transporter permease [Desulforhopalus singaporensis]|uniref:Putative tricarboxylic transport membrane protein n=1 Tax=Desulforhopalus singaporensis TaxID=91360 RepID=A0A1H0VMS8_9BACT|nr:tripartite tricarboxylate transporter permease [Desulforhopalus singaporensis]SDP79882.1 putative tricarboxylic transport membrane protein [Desulforhopalus singaporensis]